MAIRSILLKYQLWYIGAIGMITILEVLDSIFGCFQDNKIPFACLLAWLTGSTFLVQSSEDTASLDEMTEPNADASNTESESIEAITVLSVKTSHVELDATGEDEACAESFQFGLSNMCSKLCEKTQDLLNWPYQNETCSLWLHMANVVAGLVVWIALLVTVMVNMVPEKTLKCAGSWCKKLRFTFTEEPKILDEVNPYSLAYIASAFSIMVITMATCGKRAIFIWQSLMFPGMTRKQIAHHKAKLQQRKRYSRGRFTDIMHSARKIAFTPMPAMPWLEATSVEYTPTEEQKSHRSKQPSTHGAPPLEGEEAPEQVIDEALEIEAEEPLMEEVPLVEEME